MARRIFAIIGLGIAMRLAMLAVIEPFAHFGGGDDANYLAIARSLIEHGTYAVNGAPTFYRPPAYPAFLAALGAAKGLVLLAQSCLTIGVAVLALITLRSFLAAALIATSPFLIIYEYSMVAEALLVALVTASWLIVYVPGARRAALAGLLMGGAILTRDTVLFLPLFMIPFGFLLGRSNDFLVAAAIAYLVVLPWPIRNASLPDGQFVLSQGRAGFNLWIGTWERTNTWMLPDLEHAVYPADAFANPDQERAIRLAFKQGDDRAFARAATDRIKRHPFTTIKTWIIRYPRLWLGTRTDQAGLRAERGNRIWTLEKILFFLLNLLTLAAGFAGLGAALLHRHRWSLFAIPVVYTALVYVPFHNTETRYSLPALPFLLIFATYAVIAASRLKSMDGSRPKQ